MLTPQDLQQRVRLEEERTLLMRRLREVQREIGRLAAKEAEEVVEQPPRPVLDDSRYVEALPSQRRRFSGAWHEGGPKGRRP